jgi:hypothetical protein
MSKSVSKESRWRDHAIAALRVSGGADGLPDLRDDAVPAATSTGVK